MNNYPLTWPKGWSRTKFRRDARFTVHKQYLSVWDGVGRVKEELRLFGVPEEHIIISTNIEVRKDGMPRSDRGEPADPGVAVYWKKSHKEPIHKVMPIDHYNRVADNLAAVAACIAAIRSMDRHGGSFIVERAFTGFLALPAPNTWRAVMLMEPEANPELAFVKQKYRGLAETRHPDKGGSDAAMAELNWAMSEAERELTA